MSALAWPANVAHYRSRQAFSGLFALHFAPGKNRFVTFSAEPLRRLGRGEKSTLKKGERVCVCALVGEWWGRERERERKEGARIEICLSLQSKLIA